MTAFPLNKKKLAEAGFTLVEIAIVLVIIGLLLGGILKGQEMINQARIKNVVNDFNGITTAVTSYQDRYRALPGDDANAAARWTTQAPANGNGDGTVTGLYNANNTGGTGGAPLAVAESNLFWQHLRLAGFVPGVTVGLGSGTPPQNATGGMIGVETGGGCTGCGLALGFTTLIVCNSNVPDKVASAVDAQMDDANPATGQVRAQLQTGPSPVTVANPVTAYVETGTNQFLICKNF